MHPCPFPACRVYARESKKIKAKAIDSNTTALDESKAEQEVRKGFPRHALHKLQTANNCRCT